MIQSDGCVPTSKCTNVGTFTLPCIFVAPQGISVSRSPGGVSYRLDRNSPIPLWSQLHDNLAQRMEAGEFTEAFPSELELVESYGVSRNTVREALRRLRSAGLVDSSRGQRPRLAIPAEIEQPLGALYSLFSSVEAAGLEQTNIVRALELRKDAEASARLGGDPGRLLVYLERLRLAAGEPLALDRIWLPAEIASPLLDVDFTHIGFYDELASRTGIRLTDGTEHIRAVIPPRAERELLAMAPEIAAFSIERLGRVNAEPIEWRRTVVRGDRFSVTAEFSARAGYQLAAPTADREA
jgi:GntR family transcriptional regulator